MKATVRMKDEGGRMKKNSVAFGAPPTHHVLVSLTFILPPSSFIL
jgi:hypothetical protein